MKQLQYLGEYFLFFFKFNNLKLYFFIIFDVHTYNQEVFGPFHKIQNVQGLIVSFSVRLESSLFLLLTSQNNDT